MRDKLKAQSWCLKNNILIYPETVKGTRTYRIMINFQGKLIPGKIMYAKKPTKKNPESWVNKIWELYDYYYNKNNKE